MFKTNTAPKPRTIVLLVLAGVVLVMTFNIVTHWPDFMEGFRQGLAVAKGKHWSKMIRNGSLPLGSLTRFA